MDNKLNIYGELSSGIVGGFVTDVSEIRDGVSTLTQTLADKAALDTVIKDFTYSDNYLILTRHDNTTIRVDISSLKEELSRDGMLDDVSIITSSESNPITYEGVIYKDGTKFIAFKWNTSAGHADDYLKADEIGKIYNAGTGISINDNNISVANIPDETVMIEEIPVGGTPLADILTSKGINKISAGNLKEVLTSLFSNETWPANPSRTVPTTATVNMSAPTCTLGSSIAVVGSTVTLSASSKAATGSAKVAYSGFDNGWSKDLAKTNTGNGNPSPVTASYSITRASGEYSLSFTVNSGFTGATISTATGSNGGTATKSQSLTVAKGTNKVTCTASSPVFKIDISAEPKYYALSTLKNASEEHIVAASSASTINNLSKTGVTTSATVTGVYPIYSNAVVYSHTAYANGGDGSTDAKAAYSQTNNATGSSITETALTSLTNGTSKFYTFLGYGNGGFTIEVPEGWKITTAQDKNPLNTGYFDSNFTASPVTSTVTKTFGSANVTYTRYVYSIAANNICRLLIEPK